VGHRVLLVSDDATVVSVVRAVAAAAGVEVLRMRALDPLDRVWAVAAVVIVGPDVAPEVLPRARRGIVVVTPSGRSVWELAAAGRAEVITLPHGEPRLCEVLAGARARGDATVIGVIGAAGGVGVTTLAASVALGAGPSLLVDADPCAGVLEAWLGVERHPGLRWPDLIDTDGPLRPPAEGSLAGLLPRCAQARVLTMAARDELPCDPGPPLPGVLRLAREQFDTIVVDLPRVWDGQAALGWRNLDRVLLVVPDAVAAVLSARRAAEALAAVVDEVALVVRRVRGGVGSAQVGDVTGREVIGDLAELARVRAAAEAGDLGAALAGRTSRALARRVLDWAA
jgi:secretion/DNA translocation related CpaE-like protein